MSSRLAIAANSQLAERDMSPPPDTAALLAAHAGCPRHGLTVISDDFGAGWNRVVVGRTT